MDGLPSLAPAVTMVGSETDALSCTLFPNVLNSLAGLQGSDLCELRRHTYGNSVDRTTVKKLLRKVFPRCRCREKLRQQRERERAAQVAEFEEDGIDYAMLSEDANSPAQVSTGPDCPNNDQNTASAVSIHPTADSSEAPLACSCPGHVVAVPVEAAVQALDMTEEEKGPPQVKWLADCYHAGKSAAQRRQIQKRFMSGELRIVVATVAFGMGLDKSDVRAIIHYNMPKSFENYVQEIGRAGRDGKPSHCHLFLNADGSDLCELRRHTYGNSVDRTTVKKLLRKVFPRCRCREKLRQQRERERAAQVQEPEFEEDGIDYAMLSEDANTPAQVSTGHNDQNTASVVCNHETADSSEAPLPCSCPGHVVAVPVEAAVQALDMTEEGIATLLCYLELHQRKWIEVLQPIRAFCTIQFYGGPGLLRQLARTNPIIAAAIAMGRKKGVDHSTSNRLEFNVVELADRMGWDLEPVTFNLEPTGYQRTGLLAEFTDVSFLLRAPGDLTDDQLDEVSDFLYGRVESQERTELRQLKAVFQALTDVSHDEFWHCAEEVDRARSEQLKVTLREYFEKEPTLNVSSDSCGEEQEEQFWHCAEEVDRARSEQLKVTLREYFEKEPTLNVSSDSRGEEQEEKVPLKNEGQVRADIRSFVCLHHDRNFTGRAIARIFHGITSPCYPAQESPFVLTRDLQPLLPSTGISISVDAGSPAPATQHSLSSLLRHGLDDADSHGLLRIHVAHCEATQGWVIREGLHTHGPGGDHMDDGRISRLEERGVSFQNLAGTTVDLFLQLGKLAGFVGGVAIHLRRVAGVDLD
uniref:DNA 3'-5' helicase n=1 Tax=Branchiostoma floridae TaxID=7739 RepID=C3YV12_BRAFL|eukprot:XP_002599863.1 hypothetical protein BRAFLDRAFT_127645 [Branchiostoma floridae]